MFISYMRIVIFTIVDRRYLDFVARFYGSFLLCVFLHKWVFDRSIQFCLEN